MGVHLQQKYLTLCLVHRYHIMQYLHRRPGQTFYGDAGNSSALSSFNLCSGHIMATGKISWIAEEDRSRQAPMYRRCSHGLSTYGGPARWTARQQRIDVCK